MRNSKKETVLKALYAEPFQKCAAFIEKHFNKFSDSQACKDIVQESIIDLWREYTDKPIKELEKLLFTIAYNKAASATKKLGKYQFTEWDEQRMAENETSDAFEEDSRSMIYLLRAELFDQELKKLGEKDRELMVMCMEKTPAKEMAQRLGYKSVQAVRNRKSAILEKMRKVLGGQVDTCPLLLCLQQWMRHWQRWFRSQWWGGACCPSC